MSNDSGDIERTLKKVTETYRKAVEELEKVSADWAEAVRSVQDEAEVATEAFDACSKATGNGKQGLFDEWYEQQREARATAHDLVATAAMSKFETVASNLVSAGLDLKSVRSSFLRAQGECR